MRKLILFILLLGVILIAAYLLLSRPSKTQTAQTSSTKAVTTDERSTLVNLAKALDLKAELRDYDYMDWIDGDNAVLPLKGIQFIVGTVNINGISEYKSIPQNDLTKITVASLSPLITKTDSYLAKQGFSKNAENTRIIREEGQVSSFTGYEKGELKCVTKIDEKTDPFGNFVCGTIDMKQANLQKDFTTLFLGPQSQDKTITSFRVQKVEDNFALGSASGQILGYMWIAKKTGSTWIVIWTGNETPTCSTMEKLGIPKSIYGMCYSGD